MSTATDAITAKLAAADVLRDNLQQQANRFQQLLNDTNIKLIRADAQCEAYATLLKELDSAAKEPQEPTP
jgi:hypothetical protein